MIQAEGREEYAIRFGDGVIEGGPDWSRADVEFLIADLRTHIGSGEYEASDYEPMTVVTRRVFTIETEWKEAP